MKKLFFTALLANVILFGLMKWGSLDWVEQENQVLPPLQEEKIHLLEAAKVEAAKSSQMAAAAIPVPAEQLQLSMNISDPSLSQKEMETCLEWGDFSGLDLERAATALAGLPLVNNPGRREMEQDTGYWVYIPPLKNKSVINKKIGELKSLGINEYFVVTNTGRMQYAISLGVFKTQEAAQNFLNYLRTKGVRSAQLGEHASKLKTTRFVLAAANSETRNRLIALQKDFSGSNLVTVPCQAH